MTTLTATPGATPSQTVGPFFTECLLRLGACRNVLVQDSTLGARIRIAGRVLDGDDIGVPDALVEIWQADSAGRYRHPADRGDGEPQDPTFIGFGRSGTDASGFFWFDTIRPGAVPLGDGRMQAPHLCVIILARGLLNHLATRLYFADEPATASDPILQLVPAPRRATLIAQPGTTTSGMIYRWNIILQGTDETAFFNL